MTLEKVRREIDVIDDNLTDLLLKRLELAFQTSQLKDQISDPVREKEILDRVSLIISDDTNKEFIRNIFNEIFSQTRVSQLTRKT